RVEQPFLSPPILNFNLLPPQPLQLQPQPPRQPLQPPPGPAPPLRLMNHLIAYRHNPFLVPRARIPNYSLGFFPQPPIPIYGLPFFPPPMPNYSFAFPPLEQQQIPGVIPYYRFAFPPLEQQEIQGVIPPLARPPLKQQQIPGVIPPWAPPPLEQPVPLPPPAIEHPLIGMGEIPSHLQDPPHKLYRLCRKQLSRTDLQGRLTITGPNRDFVIQKVREEPELNLPVLADVTILDGPGPSPHWLNVNNNSMTLAWNELLHIPSFELVEEQMVDMWFEIVPPTTMNIYIRGDPPLEDM
ncbi:hypothetical protein MKW98_007995, partial [Papaver atlanticum]